MAMMFLAEMPAQNELKKVTIKNKNQNDPKVPKIAKEDFV